jgi:DeoR/GlpR family transcriptional regulator of sugar metabolism
MIKAVRQQIILNRIKVDHRIYITSLCEELGISDDTLRRDLIELDKQGHLTKVHGGAVAKSGVSVEFTDRLNTGLVEKQRMAVKVIPMFHPGDILLIDGGTSNLELARQLPVDMKLTVYTNSFPVINALFNHSKIELIFLGGKVFPSSQVTVGVSVYQALQTIRADWLILGVSNIHPKLGLTAPDREEAMVKRLMLERARKRIVLADNYKFKTAESYCIASLDDIDYLVIEDSKIEYIKQHLPIHSCVII